MQQFTLKKAAIQFLQFLVSKMCLFYFWLGICVSRLVFPVTDEACSYAPWLLQFQLYFYNSSCISNKKYAPQKLCYYSSSCISNRVQIIFFRKEHKCIPSSETCCSIPHALCLSNMRAWICKSIMQSLGTYQHTLVLSSG